VPRRNEAISVCCRLARRRCGESCLATGAVDLVWTMESSEHFRDKAAYFRRAARSLRGGGRLLLAAWTGSMHNTRVSVVADTFLCPSIQTAEDYQRQIEHAGLRIRCREEIAEKVMRTWEICFERSRKLRALVRICPRGVRDFVHGIGTVLQAYRSGDLTYSVIVAEKLTSTSEDPDMLFPPEVPKSVRPGTDGCMVPAGNRKGARSSDTELVA